MLVSDRDRMIVVSLLPVLSIALLFVSLIMQIGFDGSQFSFDPDDAPPDWPRRIDGAASYAAGFLSLLSITLLFIAGTRDTSRQLGSWAAAFGGLMIITAAGSAAFVVFVYLETSANSFDIDKWYVYTWAQLAYITGLIAVGYAFLAYRGLTTPGGYGRRLSARRRRGGA
jgi:hypothetical protein